MSTDNSSAGGAGSLPAAPSHPEASQVSPAAGELSSSEEVFQEPLAPEFHLGRSWVLWEHYDPAPGASYKKKATAASWAASAVKLAWFHDIVTFWQLWQGLPFSSLERFFYNKDSITVPVYTTGTAD